MPESVTISPVFDPKGEYTGDKVLEPVLKAFCAALQERMSVELSAALVPIMKEYTDIMLTQIFDGVGLGVATLFGLIPPKGAGDVAAGASVSTMRGLVKGLKIWFGENLKTLLGGIIAPHLNDIVDGIMTEAKKNLMNKKLFNPDDLKFKG